MIPESGRCIIIAVVLRKELKNLAAAIVNKKSLTPDFED